MHHSLHTVTNPTLLKMGCHGKKEARARTRCSKWGARQKRGLRARTPQLLDGRQSYTHMHTSRKHRSFRWGTAVSKRRHARAPRCSAFTMASAPHARVATPCVPAPTLSYGL